MLETYIEIYELCIAMVTALLGLSYPLFMAQINKIKDKYKSRRLAQKFRNEWVYRFFNVEIVVCIILLFIVPFLIAAFDNNYWNRILILIQSLNVFVLSMSMVRLYHLVLTYSNLDELYNRILASNKPEVIFEDLCELIFAAATDEEQKEVYNTCMDNVFRYIIDIQYNILAKGSDDYSYPAYIVNAINRFIHSSEPKTFPLLSRDLSLIDALYCQSNNFPITDQVYRIIWSWATEITHVDNEVWLQSYWLKATQYYMFHLKYSLAPHDEETRDKFKEFHLMYCTLLLHQKKYKALLYTFFYSNTIPKEYPLIPNSIVEIFKAYSELSKKNKQLYLLMHYHMPDTYDGAGEETTIEGFLASCCAVLLVRTTTMQQHYIYDCSPLEAPAIPDDIKEIEDRIRLIELFDKKIDALSAIITNELHFSQDSIYHIKRVLYEHKKLFTSKIKAITTCPKIDTHKLEKLKTSLLDIPKVINEFFKIKDDNSRSCKPYDIKPRIMIYLNEHCILEGYSYYPFETNTLLYGFKYEMSHFFIYHLLTGATGKTITIPYPDCGQVLQKLRVTEGDYVFIASGLSSSFFDEIEGFEQDKTSQTYTYKRCRIYEFPSNETSLIILRKELMPYFQINKDEDDYDKSKRLASNIYSNLNQLKPNELKLEIYVKYRLQVPEDAVYLKLDISYSLTSDKRIVSNLFPIYSYLKK